MMFELGTKLKSRRDPGLRGTVVGYGTLVQAGPEHAGLPFETTIVYLVWWEGCPGSSSLGPAIRIFHPDHVEVASS